jgi:hypothetical protein
MEEKRQKAIELLNEATSLGIKAELSENFIKWTPAPPTEFAMKVLFDIDPDILAELIDERNTECAPDGKQVWH